jgi:hypothetical protein
MIKNSKLSSTNKEAAMSQTKHIRGYLLAILLLLAFVSSELFSQNFTNNTGGTYQVGTSTGTIRMRASGGQFDGSAPLGTTSGTRIPGTVVWISNSASPMTVGAGGPYYYTNLGTDGTAQKNFTTDAYISGTYNPQNGNRNYGTVTIHYDGTSAQTIAGENSTNGGGYYGLDLVNSGAKSVASGTTVLVTNVLTHSGGDLTNSGTFNLSNTAASTSSANITNNGTWNFQGSGTFSNTPTFTNNSGGAGGGVYVSGTGALTFQDFTNTSGAFTLNANTTVYLTGSITRAAGTFTFDCASNFHYSGGAQTVLGNVNPDFTNYGNLFLEGTGAKTAGGNITLCSNLSVTQEVDMAPGSNDYILTMQNTGGSATVSYTGNVEVRGKMRWENMTAGTAYTFNNTNTQVTFSTVPTWFQLDVRQQTTPTNLNNFDLAKDIRRSITANFNGTGTISALTISWESTDEDGSFNGDRNLARFAEGYSSTANHDKLVRTGATYSRTVGTDPRYITYSGGSGPGIDLIAASGGGTVTQLSDGSNILITTTPLTIISVTNGRWTNPGTWDVGVVPTASDDVEIRHIVWTGIDQAVFGGSAWAVDEVDGSNSGDAGAAANKITIGSYSGATLVIGNQDPTMGTGERIFRTRLVAAPNYGAPGIFNNNVNANSGDGDGTSATGLNGIWVRTPGAFTPVLGTLQLTNSGSVVNRSIIEIGQ